MTPTYAVKNGVRYRNISASLNQGGKARAGNLSRVPALEIEALVIAAVRKRLGVGSTAQSTFKTTRKPKATKLALPTDKSLIVSHVGRVDVKRGQLAVKLKSLHENQNPRGHERKTGAECSSSPIEDDGSDDHLIASPS